MSKKDVIVFDTGGVFFPENQQDEFTGQMQSSGEFFAAKRLEDGTYVGLKLATDEAFLLCVGVSDTLRNGQNGYWYPTGVWETCIAEYTGMTTAGEPSGWLYHVVPRATH